MYSEISLCYLSESNRTLGVIPDQINAASLSMEGEWSKFTLSWDATPVQHGQVTYQLMFSYAGSTNEPKVFIKIFCLLCNCLAFYTIKVLGYSLARHGQGNCHSSMSACNSQQTIGSLLQLCLVPGKRGLHCRTRDTHCPLARQRGGLFLTKKGASVTKAYSLH